jgi:quinoprotein glucose dehydrogenase
MNAPTVATRPPYVSACLVGLIGLLLALPGAYLIALGGSWYYLLAGIAIVVSAVLLARGRRTGCYLYGITFAATVVWSLWEVGLDFWALIPRLVLLAVVGLWLSTPWVRRATS